MSDTSLVHIISYPMQYKLATWYRSKKSYIFW